MPTAINRYATYLSIPSIAIAIAGFEWMPWYVYYATSSIMILFWYNFYLYFRDIYDRKNWRVEKKVSRPLARLSGLYVSVGVVSVARFIPYFEPELEELTRSQIVFASIFFYLAGVIGFYYMVFFSKLGLRYIVRPKIFKF